MIQSLGDILILVSIITVGVVGVLLAVFLYNLIFVIMDVRQVMKRINDVTAQIEEMIVAPVQLTNQVLGWLQTYFMDLFVRQYSPEESHAKKEKRKDRKRRKRKNAESKEFSLKEV